MKAFLRDNGLTVFFGVIFLLSLAGQSVAGAFEFNNQQAAQGREAVSYLHYLTTSDFAVDVAENWQSEFLQFFLYVFATIWLVQRGSTECKELDKVGLESDKEQRIGRYAPPDAPRWARAGGIRLAIYSRSLGLAMCTIPDAGHADVPDVSWRSRRSPSTNDGVWSGCLRVCLGAANWFTHRLVVPLNRWELQETSGVTAEQELHLAAAPWPLFVMAAEASVVQLQRQAPLDLWLVTFVEGADQIIAAAAGPWAPEAPPGTVVPWAQSFFIQMVSGRGPAVAPRVHEVPAYAANDKAPHVGAYVGVPLLRTRNELVGTLCGFAGEPQADAMAESLPLVQLVGRLLSTIVTREVEVAQREEQATAARDLAERDLLTGLRNQRGWVTALAHETQRCRRYGLPASVLVVDVQGVEGSARAGRSQDIGDQVARDALLRRTAEVLTQASRPVDIAARPGRTEFIVLAIQCDARATKALDKRIRMSLRSAGVAASVGSATRRLGEDLTETWQRAAEGMGVDQRRRRRLERARELRAEPYA